MFIFQPPDQGGLGDQIFRNFGEKNPSIMSDMDFVSDLKDVSTLSGKQYRLNDFFLFCFGVDRGKLDVLPHEFFKKLLRAEKIVFIILLQNVEARAIDQGFDVDSGRRKENGFSSDLRRRQRI